MNTDRELLELAAKAAGHAISDWCDTYHGPRPATRDSHAPGRWVWMPLDDDGDALRLAVKLGICLEFTDCADNAPVIYAGLAHERRDWPMRACFPDQYKETRRAIVTAAAEIGKDAP